MQLPTKSLLPSISSLTLEPEESVTSDISHSNADTDSNGETKDAEDKTPTISVTKDTEDTAPIISVTKDTETNTENNEDELSKTIQQILTDDTSLPKDYGEINIKGHLRFDEEMPPDDETKKNTIRNAMLYQLRDEAGVDSTREDETLKDKHIMFDTYSPNIDVTHYQMTIVHEESGYQFQNNTRSFLVPLDDEKPSIAALRWTLGEMIQKNDIIIVVKVIPLAYAMRNGVQNHKKQCKELFSRICKFNINKVEVKIIVEIRIGAPEYFLAKSMKEFDPTFFVMGTKGIKKTKITSFLSEDPSMTKHFLENGKVPVIVVNPLYDPDTSISINSNDVDVDKKATAVAKQILHKITSYPSVYDPLNATKTLEMERSASGDSSNSSVTSSRTSRFLRMSSSISRSPSRAVSRGMSLSPIRSNDSSSKRTLSPFRLFGRH